MSKLTWIQGERDDGQEFERNAPGKQNDQAACKPGSVPRRSADGRPFLWDDPHESPLATNPDGARTLACRKPLTPDAHPYSVLLQAGLAMPSLSPGTRCALTAPFHPYPVDRGRWAVCFLWRYPSGSGIVDPLPGRALPAALLPWSPDFPPASFPTSDRPAA